MALEDNDIMDRALDAAEAKLAEQMAGESAASEAPSEPAPSSEAPPTEKARESRSRDESGKFAKGEPKQKSGQVAESENIEAPPAPGAEAVTPAPDAETPIELPDFWPADLKAAAAEAPKGFVEKFLQHDAQREQWARRNANDAERGKSFSSRLYEDMGNDQARIAQHKAQLGLSGIRDEIEELHRYRSWDTIFKSDPMTAISDLMKKNGITPQHFLQSESDEPQYPQDPRIEQALADAKAAKEAADEWRKQREDHEAYQFRSQIDSFKDGTDSDGQVRRGFAEAYAPQITQATDAIQRSHPHLQFHEVLHHAYEFVKQDAKKLFGVPGRVAAPKAPVPASKALAAASSVSGAPSTGVGTKRAAAKSVDEAMDRAEEALGLR